VGDYVTYHGDDGEKLRQDYAKEAIDLAMQAQWHEAGEINRAILQKYPSDIDAHNRLGKSLMEMGEYSEAREIYNHVLELDPANIIAKKNVERLSHIKEERKVSLTNTRREVLLDIFVGEPTKVGTIALYQVAPADIVAKMAAGDIVNLSVEMDKLVIRNINGDYLGIIEPSYNKHLIRLIKGGNRYIAALSLVSKNEVKITIKEIFQHPSQYGIQSFYSNTERVRPYAKKSMLRYELDETEDTIESGYMLDPPDETGDIEANDSNSSDDDINHEDID